MHICEIIPNHMASKKKKKLFIFDKIVKFIPERDTSLKLSIIKKAFDRSMISEYKLYWMKILARLGKLRPFLNTI